MRERERHYICDNPRFGGTNTSTCFYTLNDRNPEGRTGIKGRGLLGRWGPNHAADPIVTRWKRNARGIVMENDKKVLEFVAIQRRDNHQWAIPGVRCNTFIYQSGFKRLYDSIAIIFTYARIVSLLGNGGAR